MKKQLFVILLTLFSISAISQTNTLLSKEETINYINKKVQEAIGHERIWGSKGSSEKVLECGFKKIYSGENIKYEYKDGPYSFVVEFNPAHIKTLQDITVNGNKIVGNILIVLIGQTAKSTESGKLESVNYITMVYLKSDPDNYNRISKALLHLRDLYKAEDDPFDN